MSAESVVKTSVVADTSGLQQGVAESVEGLQKIAAEGTKTAETMKSKAQAMAESVKASAGVITQADRAIGDSAIKAREARATLAAVNKEIVKGNYDAAEAIEVQAGALRIEREAVAALAADQKKLMEAERIRAIQEQRDYEEYVARATGVAEVSHKAVTDVQATSGAIRSFEGNPGIRSLEVFIGKTLGLGPALQAIFPLVGAAAFITILFDMGEKLVDLTEKALNSGKAIKEAYEAMDQPLQDAIDRQSVLNSKLQDEIDKLEKHPDNGLRTALLEATEQADKLLVSLKGDAKELEALLEKNHVSAFQQAFTNVSGTSTQEKQILKDREQFLQDLRDIDGKSAAERARTSDPAQLAAIGQRNAAAIRDRFQVEIDSYKRAAKQLVDEEVQAKVQVMAGVRGAQSVDNQAKIGDVNAVIDQLQKRQALVKLEADATPLQAKLGGVKQGIAEGKGDDGAAKKAAEAERKAEQEKYRAMEDEFHKEQQLHELSTEEERVFWQAKIGAFKAGSSEYSSINAKLAELATSEFRKQDEVKKKALEESRKENAEEDAALEAFTKKITEFAARQQADIEKTGESWDGYWASVAKGKEAAEKLSASMAEGQLRILDQERGIGALASANAMSAIHALENARALDALREELAKLEAEGKGLSKGDKDYAPNLKKQQDVKNQIDQVSGQGQLQSQTDQAAINAAIAKPYLTAFNAINSGWLKVQHDLIQGNRNISRDFAQMGLGLVQTMAQSFEKMLVQQLQADMRMVMAHRAANMAKGMDDMVASDIAEDQAKRTALRQMFIDAKKAASGAYSAMTPIPIVGPVLAPIAAAAAFTGVMALAAFEDGGIVAGGSGSAYQMGVPILAHAGERVLSYDQTQKFEGMVNGRGGGGETHIHNYGGNNFSQAGSDFKSQWAAHERHVVKRLKTLRREGKL